MANGADKTEKATPKRRADSRRKGEVAQSSELPQSISLIVVAIMLPIALPELVDRLTASFRATFSPGTTRDAELAASTLGALTFDVVRVLAPMGLAVMATSVIAQLALTGGRPNPHMLKPKWRVLNPRNGIKRVVSTRSLFELGKTVAKLVLVAAVTWTLWDQALSSLLIGPTPMGQSLPAVLSVLEDLFVRVAVLGIVIGVLDAFVVRRRYDKGLRMTKQEVKEEHKQQESSPVVKAEIRRRQMALSRNRMIASVASADVVITNPTHLAVALLYDPADPAPRVVAKGAGFVADRIREEARLHGVPIREDKPVARALHRNVEVGDIVPVELYAAIAEILASIYRARRR